MLDGTVFARASLSLSCRTATDILGGDFANIIYGANDNIPPKNPNQIGDFREPEAGASVVLIETSEGESEG
jgi:hypothetical protein